MTGSKSVLATAVRGVADPDPRRRLAAVRGLSRLGEAGEAQRGQAIELLGRLRSPSYGPTLPSPSPKSAAPTDWKRWNGSPPPIPWNG